MLARTAMPSDVTVTTPANEGTTGKNWSKRQVATLGYCVGLGFSGSQIANILGVSKNSVSMRCLSFGLNLNRRRDGSQVVPVLISKEVAAVLDQAAADRGMTRKALVEHVLATITEGGDGCFIDNVLDDVDEH